MLAPSCKVSVDKHADECHVLDVCVHPSVMEECQQDTTGGCRSQSWSQSHSWSQPQRERRGDARGEF